MHLIIVIPCYNEEKRLDASAFATYELPGHMVEFIFVNDGSRDGTLELLQQMARQNPKKISVLDLPENRGKAEAVRAGLLAALKKKPGWIGFWDADLATPLAEIKHFVEIIGDFPHLDILCGARVKLMGREVERKMHRHYLGRVFATAVSISLGIAIYDTQCGAKLFRVCDITQKALQRPFGAGWIFDVELLARYELLYAALGQSIDQKLYEVPLMVWRDIKGSKLRVTDFFVQIYNLAWIYFRYFVFRKI